MTSTPSSSSPRTTTVGFLYLVVAFCCLFQVVSCEDAKCYSPSGDLQIHDVACNPSANASFCCGRGFTCLSNKVCMLSQDTSTGDVTRVGSTYRASCTDQSWGSPECPSFCKTKPWLSINNQAVSSCGDHSWCCQDESSNAPYCCVGNDKFTLDSVKEDVVIIPAFATSQNSSSTSSNSSSRLNPATPSATSRAGSPTDLTISGTPIAPAPIASSSKTRVHTVALAIGLGIPLILALITCLFFLLRNRHRPVTPQGKELEEPVSPSADPTTWVVEMPSGGHKEFELPVEREMPAEVPERASLGEFNR